MPADQTKSPIAATTMRRFSVVRQAVAGVSATCWFPSPYRRATTDFGGGGVDVTRSITVASPAAGATIPSALSRQPLDARRRAQRVDLEAEVTIDFVLGGALLLHLLDAVAMTKQLEMLPRREEEHGDQKYADRHRAPHLEMPLAVDLADDRVVAYVLLDCVFEFAAHDACPISAARSLALRARGLRSISASLGTTGRFVRILSPKPSACSARSVCFTIRSSSE